MTTRWPVLVGIALVSVALAVGGAFEAGRRHGHTEAEVQARQDSLDQNAKQLRVSAVTLDSAHGVTTAEGHKDSVVRQARAVARSRVAIASDSQVIIFPKKVDSAGAVVDSVGPTFEVPKEVVTVLRADDLALAQDSVTMAAMAGELRILYARDTLHVARETLLQEQLDAAKPPRCGRRCGFVAGVAVVYAATHPAQIVDAVKWIIRLVH